MLGNRKKKLVYLVAIFGIAWGIDRFAVTPWQKARKDLEAQIQDVRSKLADARERLQDQARVDEEWKGVSERLGRLRGDEAATRFDAYLSEMVDQVGLSKTRRTPDANPKLVADKGFREYAVEMGFQCEWEQLVRLLLALNNSDEFVQVRRISVQSRYPKEKVVDVNMRLSTIAAANGGAR
ncbi:MAG: hypothetical protein HY716_15050 [Planctomycetes bacterium]|nr:hypothetical protein [Planctomycetota bacterium]